MTQIYIDDTVYTVTVASAATDTTITSSGTGTSLINTSAGGIHALNSISAGANVTLTDDGSGTLTISSVDTEDNLSNNTTSDLAEGTNQYFTDARVMTSLQTVSGDIIPSVDVTHNLGSSTKQWHSVYVGPGSLYIDNHKVLGSDISGDIDLTTDAGQNLNIQAGGDIIMSSTNSTTTINDNLIHLGPAANSATIQARGDLNVNGTLDIDTAEIGGFTVAGVKISNTGNIELETASPGYIHAITDDLYIGPITGAVKIDEGSITTTAGNLTIGAFGTVDIAGHYTSAETDSAISTATAALVDSAPAALDTLNELAAALGDDANFATTTATSIGTKWTQDNTKISNWDTAYGWGNHATPGYITGYTVTESDVTGHQAALSITESQISDLSHFSGAYTDLTGKPTIPSNNNELTNGAGYITTAEAISAVEGETTLDLSGTVTIDELTFTSGTYPWGESYNKLATDTNRVLELNASGSGYIYNVAPQTWIGDAAGAYFQSNSGAASTLKPFGGQNLEIGPNSLMTVSLEGDVSGGSFNGHEVVANKEGLTIPGVPAWGGYNFLSSGGGLSSATTPANGYPIVGIQQTTNINQSQPEAQFLINHMDYDISGGVR